MGNTGMLGKVQIEGDWTQKRLILPVIQAALERTQLSVARYRADDDLRETQGHDPPPRSCPRSSRSSTSSSTRSAVAVNRPGSTSRCSRTGVVLYVSDEAEIGE